MKIQWYPGHMKKALNNIKQNASRVDLLIELLDARAPLSSMNPDIEKIAPVKQILLLLAKSDLADEKVTGEWLHYFLDKGINVYSLNLKNKGEVSGLKQSIKKVAETKRNRDLKRGITGQRPLKALVCGIPNVGKSTFINTMLGKNSAKTGNMPGVTRGGQWLNINNEFLILDTPGILWPKFDLEHTGEVLALLDSINDDIIPKEELAVVFLNFLYINYKEFLFNRYNITEEEVRCELSKLDKTENNLLILNHQARALLNLIAIKKGALKKTGTYDYSRSSMLLINDFRRGRLGKISLEKP